jgi:thioredoxin 1
MRDVWRRMLADKAGLVAAVLVAIGYLLVYLLAVGDLTLDGRSRPVSVTVVANLLDLILRQRAPLQFEAVAVLHMPGVVWLLSPLNLIVGLTLGLLTGVQVALVRVAWRCARTCGLGPLSGLMSGLPGLLAGSACCAPLLFVLLGLQVHGRRHDDGPADPGRLSPSRRRHVHDRSGCRTALRGRCGMKERLTTFAAAPARPSLALPLPMKGPSMKTAMRALAGLFLLAFAGSPAFAAAESIQYSPEAFAEAQAAGNTIVVDVYADWCPTCRAQKPILDELKTEAALEEVLFVTVDYDREKDFLRAHRIPRQSTILVFQGEEEVARSIAETDRDRLRTTILSAAGG